MTEHSPADDRLLGELGDALEAGDPVPDAVLDAAKAAFSWRTIDAELAELVFDSAVDEVAGVRGETATGDRHMSFRAAGVEVEILVGGVNDRRVTGQLVPPAEAAIELIADGFTQATETDEMGRFGFDGVPGGPASLTCRFSDGRIVKTDWVSL